MEKKKREKRNKLKQDNSIANLPTIYDFTALRLFV